MIGAVAIVSLAVAIICIAFVKLSPRAEEVIRRLRDRLDAVADTIEDFSTSLQVIGPQSTGIIVQKAPRDELRQGTFVSAVLLLSFLERNV